MDDIGLWKSLTGSIDEDAAALAERLTELSQRSITDRWPFFGLISPLLKDNNARLRRTAVEVLAGANGRPALNTLIACLRDKDADVRSAAVAALGQSLDDDPLRFAHVFFHPDADVRREALQSEPNSKSDWMQIYLIADPELRSAILPRLDEISLPGRVLPVITDFAERKLLTEKQARFLISRMLLRDWQTWVDHGRIRPEESRREVLNDARRLKPDDPLPAVRSHDSLDDIIGLFQSVDENDSVDVKSADRFWDSLLEDLLYGQNTIKRRSESRKQSLRVVASIFACCFRTGEWNRRAAELCCVFYPEYLNFEFVPREVRRSSISGLYRAAERCLIQLRPTVRDLLQSEIARRTDGLPDLAVAGGLLYLLSANRFREAIRVLGKDTILKAAATDLESAARFLCVQDGSSEDRDLLIQSLARQHPDQQGFLYSLLIRQMPSDGIRSFLTGKAIRERAILPPRRLDTELALDIVDTSLQIAAASGLEPTEKRANTAADLLGPHLAKQPAAFLNCLTGHECPHESRFAMSVLSVVSRLVRSDELLAALQTLEGDRLLRFLGCIDWCAGFPFALELQIGLSLSSHPHEEIRTWAMSRSPESSAAVRPVHNRRKRLGTLPQTVTDEIATCSDARLPAALAPCLQEPLTGLCAALAQRPAPLEPIPTVGPALLGSHDPLDEVAAQFLRFGKEESRFLSEVDREAVRVWQRCEDLPLIGHAWLSRWEKHVFAFSDQISAGPALLPALLNQAGTLASEALGRQLWDMAARLFGIWRFRNRARIQVEFTTELAKSLITGLASTFEQPAAKTLIHIAHSNTVSESLDVLKTQVEPLLPDLAHETRVTLQPWIDSRGIGKVVVARRLRRRSVEKHTLESIRHSVDLDALEESCCDANATIVDEAALRLLEIGEPGVARILHVLRCDPPPASAAVLASTVSLWPAGPTLDAVRDWVKGCRAEPELRFLAAIGLVQHGDSDLLPMALEAASQPDRRSWFRPEDWQKLLDLGVTLDELSLQLVESPHPHAYGPAVRFLVKPPPTRIDDRKDALRRFLTQGTSRMEKLRFQAARWLHNRGDKTGFPIMISHEFHRTSDRWNLLGDLEPELVDAVVESALIAGDDLASEEQLQRMLTFRYTHDKAKARGLERLLAEGTNHEARQRAEKELRKPGTRTVKVRKVAEEFAWGIRRARELTGRVFQIEMLSGEDLGYTRLTENRVYINALPLMRNDQNSRSVVQGLILHELGHHIYHAGDENLEVWDKARDEGLMRLLNLVSDEHLERNLRARESAYGDRLKTLNAHAFQHQDREIEVIRLLESLQGRSFEVLSRTRLRVARRRGSVLVDSGAVLHRMEQSGLSFARFMRALRMGLGDRHDDPRVAEGLKLFTRSFRKKSLTELLDITRQLKNIFGWEASLLETFGQDSSLAVDDDGELIHGEGITNEDVQSEIQRISDPAKKQPSGSGAGRSRWINVSADESFETITDVVPVVCHPQSQRELANQVRRPARQLRDSLKNLGLAFETQRLRTQGRRLDRSRIPALVTRSDPRVLMARQLRVQTDLFIGVVIDCSGSMAYGDHMDKARLFGALIAEAVRGMAAIDLRIFGFTDATIYDAGDANHPAIHSLEAGGGNNDAAGLWHAARVAMNSRRRSKLLVMISDGLPTECSTEALKALVARLSNRMGILCAQVAVQPLEEVCFPHYILLDDEELVMSVRRFAETISRLIHSAVR